MPIFRFSSLSEYKRWINKLATPERYIVAVTEDKEVIMEPIKATRPLLYGHMVVHNEEERKTLLKELKDVGFEIFNLKDFSYDTERPPGTRIMTE